MLQKSVPEREKFHDVKQTRSPSRSVPRLDKAKWIVA